MHSFNICSYCYCVTGAVLGPWNTKMKDMIPALELRTKIIDKDIK